MKITLILTVQKLNENELESRPASIKQQNTIMQISYLKLREMKRLFKKREIGEIVRLAQKKIK